MVGIYFGVDSGKRNQESEKALEETGGGTRGLEEEQEAWERVRTAGYGK